MISLVDHDSPIGRAGLGRAPSSPGTCSSPEVTATVLRPSSLREDDGFRLRAIAHNEIDTTNVENNFSGRRRYLA